MSQPDHTHIHTLVIFKSFAHESEAQTGESHWFTLITMLRTIFGVYVTGTEKDVNKEKNILHKKGRRLWSLLQVWKKSWEPENREKRIFGKSSKQSRRRD